jgi:hypothetical protein
MMPNAITLLFKEARDAFPPFKGKPTDNNLLLIRERLLPILMEIPYDQLGGVHSLIALLTDPARYAANHGATFVRPIRLPLNNDSIANNTTTVVRVCAELAHKARLNNFASYKAAKHGATKFLRETIYKVWYNDLKDTDTFYTKVSILEIMTFLDANSRGLHTINMITLCTNMHQYYVQKDGIPQYIILWQPGQKGGDSSGDSNNSGKRGTGHADPIPRQLLLDTWALMQLTPHQCHLQQQGRGLSQYATALNTMGGSTRDKGWD